jgi:hypothetical protein
MIRKTSLLRKINPIARRSSFARKIIYNSPISLILRRVSMRERRNDLEITNEIPQNCFCRSQTRINLLFTMSDITHAAVHPDCACELMFRGRLFEAPSIFDFIWWSQTGSNRRPHACKARALPAELWPRTRRRMRYVDC